MVADDNNTSGVFQTTYFRTKNFMFWVHQYTKYIQTEKCENTVYNSCTIQKLSVQLRTVDERHIGGGGGVMALMCYQTLVHTS